MSTSPMPLLPTCDHSLSSEMYFALSCGVKAPGKVAKTLGVFEPLTVR